MQLPTNFKATIKKTFYDKEITLYSKETVKEADGWTRQGNLTSTGTFLGNANFSNFKQIQEDYGITEQIDLVITTDVTVEKDQILGYAGKTYKVIDAKAFDSHILLICQVWSSKLSTSISA